MLTTPNENKMIQTSPAKKGFHFATDGRHAAEFIEAETLEIATEIYHQIKRLIAAETEAPEQPATPEQPVTPAPDMEVDPIVAPEPAAVPEPVVPEKPAQ